MKVNSFSDLRNYLHQTGAYWYLWTLESKQSIWAKVGEELTIPNSRANVYFGVNPSRCAKPPIERTKMTDIAGLNCVYAEYDCKDYGSLEKISSHIRTLRFRPTVVVFSGGGYHCYTFLKETLTIKTDEDLERARKLQAGWVEYTRSDKGAKDITRVLRVPSTRNWKPQYAPSFPEVKIVFSDTARVYTAEQLESVLPKPQQRTEPREQHFGKGYVETALKNEVERVLRSVEGERNNNLNIAAYSLGRLIGQNGLSRSRVEGMLLCAALGAGLPEKQSIRTIQSGLDGVLK